MPLRVVPQRDRKLYGLFKDATEASLSRGQILYAHGQPAEHLYLVGKGHVCLDLPTANGAGRGRTVAVAGPWEVFGEDALRQVPMRRTQARAGEVATVFRIPAEGILQALRSTKKTLPLLLDACVRDLDRARWAGPGNGGPSTVERLADLLVELSERFGEPRGRGVHIPHWFTHRELADLIGGHRSTVTTHVNEWIYDGVLKEADPGWVVVRPAELRRRGSGREEWVAGR